MIDFQGKLTDNNNNPQAGSFNMTFKIYNQSSGGALLWQENKLITVTDGLFSTLLGSVNAINLTFGEDYYVEMVVSGETFSPRYRVATAPYAFRANITTTAIAGTTTEPSFVINSISSQSSNLTEWRSSTGTVLASVNASGNFVLSRNLTVGSSGLFVDSVLGRVGIGTTGPNQKLHVEGNVNITEGRLDVESIRIGYNRSQLIRSAIDWNPSGWPYGDPAAGGSTSAGDKLMFYSLPGTGRGAIGMNGNVGLWFQGAGTQPAGGFSWWTGNTPNQIMILEGNTGNLGLGTNLTPTARLHVSGTNTANNLSLNVNNTLYVNNSGNVGIGTASPSAKLDIKGAIWQSGNSPTAANMSTDYMRINSENSANGATNLNPGILLFGGNQDANVYGIDLAYRAAYGPRLFTAGDIYFDYTASTPPTTQSNFVNLMTIKNTGLVGIGTASPSARLEINETNLANNLTLIVNNTLYVNNSGGGRVGIGTTSPSAKLEVAGSANITSGLNVSAGGIRVINGLVDVPGTLRSPIKNTTFSAGANNLWIRTSIQGRYLYLVDSDSRLMRIYDVIDPVNARLISSINVTKPPIDIDVAGDLAFVALHRDNQTAIYNISNPASPDLIATFNTNVTPVDVLAYGRYLFVAGGLVYSGNIQVFDIANPRAPVNASYISTGDTGFAYESNKMAISGRYLYYSNYANSLRIYDISNPYAITLVSNTPTAPNPTSIAVSEGYAYLAAFAGNAIQVFNVTNVTAPTLVANVSRAGPMSVDVLGKYLYVGRVDASTSTVIDVYDVSTPSSPAIVSNHTLYEGGRISMIEIQGRYMYVSGWTSMDFYIFDLGGAYVQNLETGTIETTVLAVKDKIKAGSAVFKGAVSIDGSLRASDFAFAGSGTIVRDLNISGGLSVLGNTTLTNYPATAISTQDLQLYLPLDGDTRDYSGKNRHARNNGSAFNSSGKIGGAYNFNGTNTLIEAPRFNVSGAVTVEAWAYRNPIAPNDYEGIINSLNGYTGANRLLVQSTVILFQIRISGDTQNHAASNLPNVDNATHHYAATYDGSRVKIYLDGAEVYNEAQTGYLEEGNTIMTIGEGAVGGSYMWNGTIDEVRIYNRSLPASEIKQHYNARATLLEGEAYVRKSGDVMYGDFNIVGNNTSRFFVNASSGNLGIGTTSPTSALHVVGDLNVTGSSYLNNINIAGTQFTSGNVDMSGNLTVHKNLSVGNSDTLFVDATNSRVGIGTASPNVNIDVFGIGSVTTVGQSEVLRLTRPNLGGGSWPQVVGFSLGRYQNQVTGYEPDTRLDINLKHLNDATLTPEVTVMTLTSAGKVGIGTTNPTVKLEISSASDTIARINTVSSGQARLEFNESGSTGWSIGERGADDFFYISNSTGNLAVSPRLVIDTSGNLGIGMIPVRQFDLNSTSDAVARINTVPTGQARFEFLEEGSTGWSIGERGVDNFFYISNSQGNLITDPRLIIDTSGYFMINGTANITGGLNVSAGGLNVIGGNVGIGTSNPGYTLEVNGSGRFVSDITMNSPSLSSITPKITFSGNNVLTSYIYAAGGGLQLNSTGDIFANQNLYVVSVDSSNNRGSASAPLFTAGGNLGSEGKGGMYFAGSGIYDVAFSTNATERMRINIGGNVGIGTTAPTSTLTINGTGMALNVINASNGYSGFFINATTGRTGIGTIHPSEKLSLNGGNFLQTFNGTLTSLGGVEMGVNVLSIYVVGKYAFLGLGNIAGNDFRIVDISNFTSTGAINAYNVSGYDFGVSGLSVNAVFVSGKYAYLGTNNGASQAFQILDISNITNPVNVSFVAVGDTVNGIYVDGKYAYLATTSGLKIVDVSDPYSPLITGFLGIGTTALSVYVQGKYAYMGRGSAAGNDFQIIDISNPTNPVSVGGLDVGIGVPAVQVQGRYAYLALHNNGGDEFRIIDVGDPSNPRNISGIEMGAHTYSVHVSGRYAYAGTAATSTPYDFNVIDISNPLSPRVVSGFNTTSGQQYVSAIFISGKYAYAGASGAISGNEFQIYDLSGIDSPAASIGSLEAGELSVLKNAKIQGSLYAASGITAGQEGIYSQGPVSIQSGTSNVSSNVFDIRNATGKTYLAVKDSGNVGIGTITPGAPLEINGSLLFTGKDGASNAAYFIGVPTTGQTAYGLTIQAGNSTASEGGNLKLLAGTSGSGNTQGGGVTITATASGQSGGSRDGGAVTITAGQGGGTGLGGPIRLTAGDSGATAGSAGGEIMLVTGSNSTTGQAGGNMTLRTGNGTAGSGHIIFQTNGSNTRMTIDTGGNVGIGTTAPSAALHVSRVSSGAEVVALKLQNSATAVNTATALGFYTTTDDLTSMGGKISLLRTNSPVDGDTALLFYTHNSALTEKMRIDGNGNVGIGMTNPSTLLTLNTSSAGFILLNRTSSAGTDDPVLFGIGSVSTGNSDDYFYITSSPDDSTARLFKIELDSGNVGIGTGNTALNAKLQVVGTANITGGLNVSAGGLNVIGGNVGIGTTNPGQKLEVAGNITISRPAAAAGNNTWFFTYDSAGVCVFKMGWNGTHQHMGVC